MRVRHVGLGDVSSMKTRWVGSIAARRCFQNFAYMRPQVDPANRTLRFFEARPLGLKNGRQYSRVPPERHARRAFEPTMQHQVRKQ